MADMWLGSLWWAAVVEKKRFPLRVGDTQDHLSLDRRSGTTGDRCAEYTAHHHEPKPVHEADMVPGEYAGRGLFDHDPSRMLFRRSRDQNIL